MFINDYYRKIITRWRLSNHKLKIETGRYSRPIVQRVNRVYSICNILEDEDHVVFVCPAYQPVRNKFHRLLSTNSDIQTILNPKSEFIIETALYMMLKKYEMIWIFRNSFHNVLRNLYILGYKYPNEC